ncbi:hypothetical protein [Ruegeria arenilitoris]|uniref:hypothetical protein n=1 Tax=Ruegeria arenilitoris TaxID=1173585 RepID=UPI00147EC94B|nr:hypothetical protein [Ruegeria arenilitoris]
MYLVVWIAPAVPLILSAMTLTGLRGIPTFLAHTLFAVTLLFGVFFTIASGVLSLFSTTQLLHGFSLTMALGFGFLIWSEQDGKVRPSRFAKLGMAVSVIPALWSLLTVPMILIQTRVIAGGSPYCIAEHAENSPIETLHQLRGFSFYTAETGYKSTSEWYFHGLLIVDDTAEERIYNWSPRRWRFDLVERPDALIKQVTNLCVPS